MIFLHAFRTDFIHTDLIEGVIAYGAKGFGCVALALVFGQNSNTDLRASAKAEVIENNFSDHGFVDTDGKIHCRAAAEILFLIRVEIFLVGIGTVLSVIVPPEAVALVVQTKAVIRGNIGLVNGVQGEALGFDMRNFFDIIKLVFDTKMVFFFRKVCMPSLPVLLTKVLQRFV